MNYCNRLHSIEPITLVLEIYEGHLTKFVNKKYEKK